MTPVNQTSQPVETPTASVRADPSDSLARAAQELAGLLERGTRLEAHHLRSAMNLAFGASDAEGAWVWKDAFDAVEAAQILFLRRFYPAIRKRAATPLEQLAMLEKVAALTPTHTRRSEESQSLQQFSTPIELAFAVACTAQLTADDHVLEPSAGTGMLAIFGELAGASLSLNELGQTRAGLLERLFPNAPVTRFNAEAIHDFLPDDVSPSVVLMNPPFTASPNITRPQADAAKKHIRSALERLGTRGRLVTITGSNIGSFADFDDIATQRFSAILPGRMYCRHGTTTDTRLTVFDRIISFPRQQSNVFQVETTAELIDLISKNIPPRATKLDNPTRALPKSRPAVRNHQRPERTVTPTIAANQEQVAELVYTFPQQAEVAAKSSDALYETYRVESIIIEDAKPHPTQLVQSAAMASVRPPKPSYRPHLPARIITDGLLSDAQIESVIYAGEAHGCHLPGRWLRNESFDVLTAAPDNADNAVSFRRGWFLGDGTGAGKGRQIAGIVLDNWLKGRRRAVWISKSETLIEDAQRDWSALGQEKLHIVPQARFRQGKPIVLSEGILFTTYATLRSAEREGKSSRLTQITDWLGADFDGVIVFDEAHAMANAAGGTSERGPNAPSQQGLAGLRIQHMLPDARVVYVSATGATTVQNLAYAQRLGLWAGDDFPFLTRADFITAIQEGGIAAMEVLARDLKALGLYAARALSYEGVVVDLLEHKLTPDQIRIYDAYAKAFQIIHTNLEAALKAANITSETGTLNRQAKSAARSAFESNKQRFFNHLITAMATPTLINSISADIDRGDSAVIQLVSTSEALMERRLANIPQAEWNDLSIDITPREACLNYLEHAFPVHLFELYEDEEHNVVSRPVVDATGQPVICKEAERRRDRMIEYLAALPPVQSALDQILHHFGAEAVSEVTGRNRRILRLNRNGSHVLAVQSRPGSANLSETLAFMDDKKRILVFSDAGGTGRSYHADRSVRNQRRRNHYLLEAGWRADTAIQGLGRTNRTNQKYPPLFRPVTTDVRGQKRFLSTIARRLDTLGAITRGQRQTGGQGLFRAEDNLESSYARASLRQLYQLIYAGKIPECSLKQFQTATALKLADQNGSLLEELPPISTFLNRVLALEIALQNQLFAHFEGLLAARVEGAMASGTYEVGLETITADSLTINHRQIVSTHAASGAETKLYTVACRKRTNPILLENILDYAKCSDVSLWVNDLSNHAAAVEPAASWTLDDGVVQPRLRLIRPTSKTTIPAEDLHETNWRSASRAAFSEAWNAELQSLPEFTTSTFHVMTGLLLPIWKQLPTDNPRVYRFTTDEGERVIGRLVPTQYLEQFQIEAPTLTTDQAWSALNGGEKITLSATQSVLPVRCMHERRFELIGFNADHLEHLKAIGLTGEIINWRMRLFVPTSEQGRQVLGRLIDNPTL